MIDLRPKFFICRPRDRFLMGRPAAEILHVNAAADSSALPSLAVPPANAFIPSLPTGRLPSIPRDEREVRGESVKKRDDEVSVVIHVEDQRPPSSERFLLPRRLASARIPIYRYSKRVITPTSRSAFLFGSDRPTYIYGCTARCLALARPTPESFLRCTGLRPRRCPVRLGNLFRREPLRSVADVRRRYRGWRAGKLENPRYRKFIGRESSLRAGRISFA